MVCQPVRIALLIGAITAVAVSPARADDKAPSTTGPAMRTIQVMECVPETYTCKRTTYKVECRTEECDSWKCVCVPEVQERTVCCVKKVPVVTTECRKVCKTVTCNETRTTYKTCWKTVEETVMKKRCTSLGHWECQTREAHLANFLTKLHHNSCDPCGQSCPKTRSHRVWVHCPTYECCPVKVCKKVCEKVPHTCVVPVCKKVWVEEKVQVCSYKCVEEKRVEKCTVNVMKKVACKSTRTVRVCVPHVETVTCTRMVQKCVTKQVPCEPACSTSCCTPSRNDCCSARHRLFRGHSHNRCDAGSCR